MVEEVAGKVNTTRWLAGWLAVPGQSALQINNQRSHSIKSNVLHKDMLDSRQHCGPYQVREKKGGNEEVGEEDNVSTEFPV